jgi:8-oxo-dGTP pyrophosphatase MutT (NUDIX family)
LRVALLRNGAYVATVTSSEDELDLGGHDSGNMARLLQQVIHTTLREAALRELTEETGISAAAITPASHQPLHIDVHPIPANHAKGEPRHQHIDFRFLFHTAADITKLQAEEIRDAAWLDTDAIADERLRQQITNAFRSQGFALRGSSHRAYSAMIAHSANMFV